VRSARRGGLPFSTAGRTENDQQTSRLHYLNRVLKPSGQTATREQINERAKRRKIAPVPADQFLVTLIGSCLYPFVGQPMMAEALGLGPKELRDFMKRRRTELPALLKRTL